MTTISGRHWMGANVNVTQSQPLLGQAPGKKTVSDHRVAGTILILRYLHIKPCICTNAVSGFVKRDAVWRYGELDGVFNTFRLYSQ